MEDTTALTQIVSPSVHLVARNPQQMAAAQADLLLWLRAKRDEVLQSAQELEAARDTAKRHKWNTHSFSSAISKFRAQHDFYQKLVEAVMLGYTIVPNIPVDVFAVRVDRGYPAQGEQYGGTRKGEYLAEIPDILPVGEGEYVSPKPKGYQSNRPEKQPDGKMANRWYFVPTSLQNAEFPFAIARPEIMTAVAEAMAHKVFDQIGVCSGDSNTSRRGKGDPLVIGRVALNVEKYGHLAKPVSFLIAWHLDLRTL